MTMKSDLINYLLEADDFVSGQEIANKLNISRNAVWKAINKARKEGFEIEAVPNRGYRIVSTDDVFNENTITAELKTKWLGADGNVVFIREIDSTNEEAKRRSMAGAGNGLLIAADFQSAGKGRRGRTWQASPGTTIAMSYLLKPDFVPDLAPMMTLLMAMATAKAIREVAGLEAEIKWPNDVIVGGKKLVGILTEMAIESDYIQYVVIGTGINVNVTDFPDDIKDKATSLLIETGKKVSRAKLVAAAAAAFEEYYEVFCSEGNLASLREEYNSLCVNVGRRVRVLDPKGEYEADAYGINEKGELRVRCDDGSEVLVYAGEVSVRGIYGYT